MRIGIIGNGVVGNATGKALAPHVDEVLYYDVDPAKCTGTKRDALYTDLIFVCLPTPQKTESFECDTSILDEFFCLRLGDADEEYEVRKRNFVLRSTVPVGYTRQAREAHLLPNLVHSPEFLTARTAEHDAANPTRLVIGNPNGVANTCTSYLTDLYQKVWPHITHRDGRAYLNGQDFGMLGCGGSPRESGAPIFHMTSDESEFVKLMQNVFSAVKISFFNEMRCFSDARNMDWERCMSALLAGGWVNPMHTQVPGPDGKFGFGGTCLPKDLANMIQCLEDAGVNPDGVCFAAHKQNKIYRRE